MQYEQPREDHGEDRGPVQGPGLHLRRERDLRRPRQHLGLRPPGRGAEKQREESLVEEVRPGEPLQRGPGRRHPHEPPGVGGLRPCGRVLRPPHGLQGVQGALPGRQAHRGLVRGKRLPAGKARGRILPGGDGSLCDRAQHPLPHLRQAQLHRHPQVQPDVQDLPGRH